MSEAIYTFVGQLPRPIHTLVAGRDQPVTLAVRVDPVHELDLAGTLEELFDWQPLTAQSVAEQCHPHPHAGELHYRVLVALKVLEADPAVQLVLMASGDRSMTIRREGISQ